MRTVLRFSGILGLMGLCGWMSVYAETSKTQTNQNVTSIKTMAARSQSGKEGAGSSDNLLFSGSFSNSISIQIPPGIAGFQPELTLQYNSGAGTSWVGHGWELSMGRIQRSTKSGSPSFNTDDTFIFITDGESSELVRTEEGIYRLKIQGDFQKFVFRDNQWIIYEKDGTRSFYGQDDSSRYRMSKGVFGWALNRIEDRNGNYLTVGYEPQVTSNNESLCMREILYGGNVRAGRSPDRKVQFISKAYDGPVSYFTGEKTKVGLLLQSIKSSIGSQTVWTYNFSYTTSKNTSRPILEKIARLGLDGVTPFPDISFSYQDSNTTQSLGTSKSMPGNWSNQNIQFVLGDFNGDGLQDYGEYRQGDAANTQGSSIYLTKADMTFNRVGDIPGLVLKDTNNTVISGDFNGDADTDLIVYRPGSQGSCGLYFSNGNGTFNKVGTCPGSDFSNPYDTYYPADYNGDGLTDLMLARSQNTTVMPTFFLSKGDGTFSWEFGVPLLTGGNGKYSYVTADFNGDGRTDVAVYAPNTKASAIYLSNPNAGNYVKGPQNIPGGEKAAVFSSDINGDGLSDLLVWENGAGYSLSDTSPSASSSGGIRIYLSKGNGIFTSSNGENIPDTFVPGTRTRAADEFLSTGDMNGDGLTDVAYYKSTGNSGTCTVYQGTPTGQLKAWGSCPGRPWVKDGSDWKKQYLDQLFFADFNGDRKSDWVVFRAGPSLSGAVVYPAAGESPDLLSWIKNGIGGSTSISYVSSHLFSPRYLPFSFPVVQKITTSSGRCSITNDCGEVSYSYEGGFYDRFMREFIGFAKVTTIDPIGNKLETFFHQDKDPLGQLSPQNVFKGRVYKTITSDSKNIPLSSTETSWESYSPWNNVYFVRTKTARSNLFDGGKTISREVSYFYDDAPKGNGFGNRIKTVSSGNLSFLGDEKTELIEYAMNPDNYLLSFPKRLLALDASEHVVSETRFIYDQLGDGSISNGNPTEIKRWAGEETWINNKTWFNLFGQPIQMADGRGYLSHLNYDSSGFPSQIINPLNHLVQHTYDPRTGQLLKTIDENGQVSSIEYDALGRVKKQFAPNDEATKPSVIYDYHDELRGTPGQYVEELTRKKDGSDQLFSKKSFYDGLNRIYMTSEQKGAQWINTSVLFDKLGRVIKTSVPSWSTDTTVRWAETEFDSHGRKSKFKTPDGNTTSYTYQGLLSYIQDPNGKTQGMEADIFGRVIRRWEPSVLKPTEYTYDSLGSLVQVIDARGFKTEIVTDALGRKISIKDPNAGLTRFEYDANGNIISRTDARGVQVGMRYDLLNRLVEKRLLQDPGLITGQDVGSVLASYSYDERDPLARPYSLGKLTRVRDASGSAMYYHDRLGRLVRQVKEVDGMLYELKTNYDDFGRVTQQSYPNDTQVKYSYDEAGRLSKVMSADEKTVYASFKNYDVFGRDLLMEQANGTIQTSYEYDAATQWIRSIQLNSMKAATQKLSYTYDRTGNIKTITQVSNVQVTADYDDLYRLKTSSGAYFGQQMYDYDAMGNMTRFNNSYYWFNDTDHPYAVTEKTGFERPAFDASTILAWNLSPQEPIYSVSGKSVDTHGTAVSEAAVSLTGSYKQVVFSKSGAAGTGEFEFRNIAGGLSSDYTLSATQEAMSLASLPLSLGRVIDQKNGLQATMLPSTNTFTTPVASAGYGVVGPSFTTGRWQQALSFNGNSDVFVFPGTEIMSPDKITVMLWAKPTAYPYPASRYATLLSKSAHSEIGKLSNGYRLVMDSSGKVHFEIGQAGQSIRVTSYISIPRDQWSFITATFDGQSVVLSFNGQVQAKRLFSGGLLHSPSPVALGASLLSTGYVSKETAFRGVLDEPRIHQRAWTPAEILAAKESFDQKTSYAYDAAGNRILKQTSLDLWSYQYDSEGRLVKVEKNDRHAAGFVYDAEGGRVKKVTSKGTTIFIGGLFEIRPDGTQIAHVSAGEKAVCDLIRSPSGTTSVQYIHQDHLGSTWLVSDASGNRIQQLEYEPFGATAYTSGSSLTQRRYTGQEEDDDIGLYYYKARYYDPDLKRFISPDSMVPNLFDPQSLNRYSYCRNNPLNMTDPSGHFFKKIAKAFKKAASWFESNVSHQVSGFINRNYDAVDRFLQRNNIGVNGGVSYDYRFGGDSGGSSSSGGDSGSSGGGSLPPQLSLDKPLYTYFPSTDPMRYSVQIAAGDGFDWSGMLDYARKNADYFEYMADNAADGSFIFSTLSAASIALAGPYGVYVAAPLGGAASILDGVAVGGYYAHGYLTDNRESYIKGHVSATFFAIDLFTGGLGSVGAKNGRYAKMYYSEATGRYVGRVPGLLRAVRQPLSGVVFDPIQNMAVEILDRK